MKCIPRTVFFLYVLFFLAVAGFLLRAQPCAAADMTPGFTTMGVWLPEKEIRLDINIWYPSVRRTSEVNYGYWVLQVAHRGKAHEGYYPLILLSHDSYATRFSNHITAAALASLGFVVAAPTHLRDNMDNMPEMIKLSQLEHRVGELHTTLNVLLQDPVMRQRIDRSRVGVLGFGVGGTAALLMGGARLSPEGWNNYCADAPAGDVYCTPWGKGRMQKLVQQLPKVAKVEDARIKAVAAVAPAYGMLFTQESLRDARLPVQLFVAEKDRGLSPPAQVERLRTLFPMVPHMTQLEGVDVPSLVSCPRVLQQQLPDMCGVASPQARRRAVERLNREVATFFLEVLGDTSPPPAPLPPAPAGQDGDTTPQQDAPSHDVSATVPAGSSSAPVASAVQAVPAEKAKQKTLRQSQRTSRQKTKRETPSGR